MDKERFLQAISEDPNDSGVGTIGEKTLHSVIKRYLQPDPAYREVKVGCGKLVADIYDGETITEIQTRNFLALKKKLKAKGINVSNESFYAQASKIDNRISAAEEFGKETSVEK